MMKEKDSEIKAYHLNRYQTSKPQLAIYDLNEYVKANKCRMSKPHIHSFYQILWFKKGKGIHSVDLKEYKVFDNTIFLIAKNQVHYFDGQTGYEGVLIHFNEIFLVNNQSEMDFFLKCSLFNNLYQQPSCRVGGDIKDLLDKYILQFKRELDNEEAFGKELLLRNYLKNFLIQIQRAKNKWGNSLDPLPHSFDEKRLQFVRFINLINEHYKKGFTIAKYARLLHISTRSLSELTHQLLNKTPSQMIQERIILEAQRMLLYSNMNVNQIGYRLGFEDASYFAKYFKKHTNISPLAFRKSIS